MISTIENTVYDERTTNKQLLDIVERLIAVLH